MTQRLALVCALALVLVPLTLAAQSTPAYQQDKTDVNRPATEPNSMQNRDATTGAQQQQDTDRSGQDPSTTNANQEDEADDAGDLPATAANCLYSDLSARCHWRRPPALESQRKSDSWSE